MYSEGKTISPVMNTHTRTAKYIWDILEAPDIGD